MNAGFIFTLTLDGLLMKRCSMIHAVDYIS